MKVVTTSGVNLKGGAEKDKPLTPDEAKKLAAAKNREAEKLSLSVRYEVAE
jgi:hypothetical protein